MPHLRLRLLGAFKVDLSSPSRTPLSVKKAQALLAYLALHPGQHEPREKLAALLWADTAEASARTNLRQTLALLRKALGHRKCPCVLNAGTALYLDAAQVEIDVIRFEQCCDQGTPEALEEAVALYQGELLAGFTLDEYAFEDWLTSERRRLHERQRQALNALLTHYMETAQHARSIDIAVKLLALDPLQEAVHRTLMQAYHAEGRRRAVLRQYENCRDILQRELGVKPEAETERLYRQLLSQPPAADAVSQPLKKDVEQTSKAESDSVAGPEKSTEETPPAPAWAGQAWLEAQGLGQYAGVFADNDIDFELLPEITDLDLQHLGISLGHRKKLLNAIATLAEESCADKTSTETPADAETDAPDSLPAERRQVTVMQINLADSSVLAEHLDAEDLGEIIRGFQACCSETVKRYEGHPASYLSDGLLVYFGYPRAHEDDTERAVRAGLEIINAVGKLELALPSAPRLHTRIGIATGRVVVDETYRGAGQAMVGETPTLAAQLQNLAEPDSVVIGTSTQRLAGGVFEYDNLGTHTLQGFSKPVQVWRVTGLQTVESRFEAAHVMGMTPLVGREAERALLWDRWQQAKTGDGQVVLLSGEPGIGKSRMIQTLQEQIAAESCTRLNYQCSPYYANSALYPITQQLQRAAGFASDDTVERRLDKLESLLAQSNRPSPDAAPLIAALLSIPSDTRYRPLNLTPQRQKQKTLDALVDQLLGLAAQKPVLFVLEDAHWIDPTTQELLDLAIDRIQAAPVLMVLTFRPEFKPPWTRYTHVTALTLNRLSQPQVIALVKQLTDGKALPDPVLDQIVAKTDGVPLFVEELTKMIITADFLHDAGEHYELIGARSDIAIPATLQDSLTARLDRLRPIREIVQTAACIGREFSYHLLSVVSELDNQKLQKALAQLIEAGLVFQSGTPPESTYVFKHVLVQDAAYASLLRSKRQQLHGAIAQALEQHFPHLTKSEPELLAQHYEQAGLAEQALTYYLTAGQYASQRSANKEAIQHLKKGLALLDSLPETPERARQELDFQIALGPSLMIIEGHGATSVEHTYNRAYQLCELLQLDESPHFLRVLYGLRRVYSHRGALKKAVQVSERCLSLAQQLQDYPIVLDAHYSLGISLLICGQLSTAQKQLEQGIVLADQPAYDAHTFGIQEIKTGPICQAYMAFVLWAKGYPEQARRQSLEAERVARQWARPFTLAHVLTQVVSVYQFRREVSVVRERAAAVIVQSVEHSFPQWVAWMMIYEGWALSEQGQAKAGIDQILRGLAASMDIGTVAWRSTFLTLLARAYSNSGQAQQGLSTIIEALNLAEKTGQHFDLAELYRLRGELQLSVGNRHEAEASFNQALNIARGQQTKSWELRAATSLARLWHDQGKRQPALDLLAPIYHWFTEGFDTADLKDAKALLDKLA